jgi:hypothetical protein
MRLVQKRAEGILSIQGEPSSIQYIIAAVLVALLVALATALLILFKTIPAAFLLLLPTLVMLVIASYQFGSTNLSTRRLSITKREIMKDSGYCVPPAAAVQTSLQGSPRVSAFLVDYASC